MTAEIAVMNKNAVALAADSAVTIQSNGRIKVHGASKLFALSLHHPVGVMVYGNAEIMRMPWDVIIKAYRKQQKDVSYPVLEDYGENFIRYLKSSTKTNAAFFSEEDQEEYVNSTIGYNLLKVKRQIEHKVEDLILEKHRNKQEATLAAGQLDEIVAQVIERRVRTLAECEPLTSFPSGFATNLADKCSDLIAEHIRTIFNDLPLTQDLWDKLKDFCVSLFVRNWFIPDCSGIVIAGFGDEDIFPSLVAYRIGGVVNEEVKFKVTHNKKITKAQPVAILPFAQTEMVDTFMNGINPNYQKTLERYVRQIFRDYNDFLADKELSSYNRADKETVKVQLQAFGGACIDDALKKIQHSWEMDYIRNLYLGAEVLPCEELATVAEYLIQFALLKWKLTVEPETVAGPVDVAIISKSGGFTWVKRKNSLAND